MGRGLAYGVCFGWQLLCGPLAFFFVMGFSIQNDRATNTRKTYDIICKEHVQAGVKLRLKQQSLHIWKTWLCTFNCTLPNLLFLKFVVSKKKVQVPWCLPLIHDPILLHSWQKLFETDDTWCTFIQRIKRYIHPLSTSKKILSTIKILSDSKSFFSLLSSCFSSTASEI